MESHSPETGQDALTHYLEQIGRYELLTAGEEVELAKTIEAGKLASQELAEKNGQISDEESIELTEAVASGHEAREQFINSNLRLVVSMAKRYTSMTRNLDFLDLIQEGNLGLEHAVEKFDPDMGFKFSTYSTWWIRQFIRRGIKYKDRSIRLPSRIEDQLSTLHVAQTNLQSHFGRHPDLEELAEESGLSIHELRTVSEVQHTSADIVSLDATLGEDTNTRLIDWLPDESVYVAEEAEEAMEEYAGQFGAVAEFFYVLSEEELKIITSRYGEEKLPWAQIEKRFKIPSKKAQELKKSAIGKLRRAAKRAELGRAG